MNQRQIEAQRRWRRLSRRGFLRTAGLASVGAAGFVLVGCDTGDDEPTPAPTPAPATPTPTPTDAETPTPTPMAAGTADVLGIWGAEELDAFEAMVEPWQERTGGSVDFVGTRDITPTLITRVEGNNPPDIAIPAEVGLFQQFAQEGRLVTLSALGIDEEVRQNYPQGFVDLGTTEGELYGFFMKADSKGTIWYNPRLFEEHGWQPLDANSTWDDLVALSEQIRDAGIPPWSIGIESGGASGWPGTDWIQQILLNEHGPDVYDGIIDGSIPMTDERMRDAWEKFGQIALGEGFVLQPGAQGINATNFVDATLPPFEAEPGAAMTYLGGFAAGFIMEQFPDAVPGEDFDFFTWPGGGITGGANIVYAFNDDATTASLMEHLASAEAQSIWVERGGFTSVHRQVALESYPDEVSRRLAEQLTDAERFRFDLDDAIGGSLQEAFFVGVTEYLANPGQLDSILEEIEGARAA